LAIRVFSWWWPGRVELNIDVTGLIHNAIQVFRDSGVIERIYYVSMCLSAGCGNLLRYLFHVRLRAAGKKNLCAARGQFLCDARANRTSRAKHHRYLLLQICHCLISLRLASSLYENSRVNLKLDHPSFDLTSTTREEAQIDMKRFAPFLHKKTDG